MVIQAHVPLVLTHVGLCASDGGDRAVLCQRRGDIEIGDVHMSWKTEVNLEQAWL